MRSLVYLVLSLELAIGISHVVGILQTSTTTPSSNYYALPMKKTCTQSSKDTPGFCYTLYRLRLSVSKTQANGKCQDLKQHGDLAYIQKDTLSDLLIGHELIENESQLFIKGFYSDSEAYSSETGADDEDNITCVEFRIDGNNSYITNVTCRNESEYIICQKEKQSSHSSTDVHSLPLTMAAIPGDNSSRQDESSYEDGQPDDVDVQNITSEYTLSNNNNKRWQLVLYNTSRPIEWSEASPICTENGGKLLHPGNQRRATASAILKEANIDESRYIWTSHPAKLAHSHISEPHCIRINPKNSEVHVESPCQKGPLDLLICEKVAEGVASDNNEGLGKEENNHRDLIIILIAAVGAVLILLVVIVIKLYSSRKTRGQTSAKNMKSDMIEMHVSNQSVDRPLPCTPPSDNALDQHSVNYEDDELYDNTTVDQILNKKSQNRRYSPAPGTLGITSALGKTLSNKSALVYEDIPEDGTTDNNYPCVLKRHSSSSGSTCIKPEANTRNSTSIISDSDQIEYEDIHEPPNVKNKQMDNTTRNCISTISEYEDMSDDNESSSVKCKHVSIVEEDLYEDVSNKPDKDITERAGSPYEFAKSTDDTIADIDPDAAGPTVKKRKSILDKLKNLWKKSKTESTHQDEEPPIVVVENENYEPFQEDHNVQNSDTCDKEDVVVVVENENYEPFQKGHNVPNSDTGDRKDVVVVVENENYEPFEKDHNVQNLDTADKEDVIIENTLYEGFDESQSQEAQVTTEPVRYYNTDDDVVVDNKVYSSYDDTELSKTTQCENGQPVFKNVEPKSTDEIIVENVNYEPHVPSFENNVRHSHQEDNITHMAQTQDSFPVLDDEIRDSIDDTLENRDDSEPSESEEEPLYTDDIYTTVENTNSGDDSIYVSGCLWLRAPISENTVVDPQRQDPQETRAPSLSPRDGLQETSISTGRPDSSESCFDNDVQSEAFVAKQDSNSPIESLEQYHNIRKGDPENILVYPNAMCGEDETKTIHHSEYPEPCDLSPGNNYFVDEASDANWGIPSPIYLSLNGNSDEELHQTSL